MIILKALLIIAVAMVGFFVFILLIASFSVIWELNHRICSVCGHTMKYEGVKHSEDMNIYIFHCENCDEQEEVPVKETFKTI